MNLTKTHKQAKEYDIDEDLINEIEVINGTCSDATSILSCQFCKACGQLSKDLEDTDQLLRTTCNSHSGLKERFKCRENEWLQTVAELAER